MAEVTRPCWQCELCGHVWLKDPNKPDPPPQCARCKKRNWNVPPDAATSPVPVVVHPLDPASGVAVNLPPIPTTTNAAAHPVFTDAVGTSGCKATVSTIQPRRPGGTPLVAQAGKIAVKREPRCPRCGRGLKQWGANMLRCDQCAANWTRQQAGV